MTTLFFIFGHLEAVETTLVVSFKVGTNAGPVFNMAPSLHYKYVPLRDVAPLHTSGGLLIICPCLLKHPESSNDYTVQFEEELKHT